MKSKFLAAALLCLAFAVSFESQAKGLKKASPESAGMDSERLEKIDQLIYDAIDQGEMPGAVLAVVRDKKLVYLKAYGNKSVYPDTVAMTTNTVFDLASCSKVVGTTMSMMHLLESGG